MTIFSNKIKCGDCGGFFGSKVWHSNDKYRRTVWQCNNKFKGDHRCSTPHLYESEIKDLFLKAFGKMMGVRESIIDDCRLVQAALGDQTELDAQAKAFTEDMEITAELIRRCVDENTFKIQNQAEYFERYERHTARYEKLKRQLESIETERQRRKEKFDLIGSFISTLESQGTAPIEFDDDLWVTIIDHVTINADESVVFTFKGGMEVTEQLI